MLTQTSAGTTRLDALGCRASWTGGVLEVGNDLFARRWILRGGRLVTAGLVDHRTGRVWALEPEAGDAADADDAAFHLAEDPRPVPPGQAAGLRVVLSSPRRQHRVELFPGLAAVRVRSAERADHGGEHGVDGGDGPGVSAGVEQENGSAAGPAPDAVDRLRLAPHLLVLDAPALRGRTDHHAEVLQPRAFSHLRQEHHLHLRGNLFCVTEPTSGDGFTLVRHGMLPHSAGPTRRRRPDLIAHVGTLEPLETPTMPAEEEGWVEGDWHALVLHGGGGPGRTATLQRYEQHLREPRARDRWMLSNTWGDRGRDGRVCEAFVLAEIQAAAALGVDVVQVDDGWQAGRSSNSAEAGGRWSGFWESEGFWEPHADRFPRGLAPLVDAAGDAGLKLGLWYAPDSSDDFAHWERDAETLLALHRSHGIDHFKIDAVMLPSGLAEARYHRLLDRVLAGSGGAIVMDLDATAGTRPDYLGRPDSGPVFVQNRYSDWGSWFPHLTLRTLWQLTHWVRPERLRMEWLNPDRNPDRYEPGSLTPAGHNAGYLFASVMVSAPLAWMELQNLSKERRAEAEPVIRRWREARSRWVGAAVLPLGAEPDGFAWTGFAVVPAEPTHPRDLLVFRENHPDAEATLRLPVDLGGEVEAWSNREGEPPAATLRGRDLTVRLPRPRSFAWLTCGGTRER